MSKDQRDIRRKRQVLEYAVRIRNIRKTCRHFGIPRSLFYVWRAAFEHDGEAGLVNKRSVARSHPRPTRPEVVEQVLHLRRIYHLVPKRIVWYLARYQSVNVSDATLYRMLRRHGLRRVPNRVGQRAVHTHRYAKQIPGHHGQVDVKFLTLQGPAGQRIRRYQYTAIDDATRIRARTQSRTPSPSQATWPGRFPSAFTRCAPTAAMSSRRCFIGTSRTTASSMSSSSPAPHN